MGGQRRATLLDRRTLTCTFFSRPQHQSPSLSEDPADRLDPETILVLLDVADHLSPGRSSSAAKEALADLRISLGTVALLLDRVGHETGVMSSSSASAFAGFRFPREVISVAVRWYLRYGLSYRDVEELLAERGVTVDHVTIYRWVQRFTPEFVEAARPALLH